MTDTADTHTTPQTSYQGDDRDDIQPTTPTSAYPPAPNPSSDPGVIPQINPTAPLPISPTIPTTTINVDILEPLPALTLLFRGVQILSDLTGDVPATPPISRPDSPRLLTQPAHRRTGSRPATPPSRVSSADIAPNMIKNSPIGSPEAHPCEDPPGAQAALRVRYDAIARKFYSKKPPPVPLKEYVMRLQRYCPMSTAVYLAACAYIHRLAVIDKTVPVTPRTAHRLVLAALRVAMKAMEDLNYPHARFAGVGGVSERELVKLELAMCYVLDFELRVDERVLAEKATVFQQLVLGSKTGGGLDLKLPVRNRGVRAPAALGAAGS